MMTAITMMAIGSPNMQSVGLRVALQLQLTDPASFMLSIPAALHAAGFTWPGVTDASDAEGGHWVFECERVNGGAVHGQL